MAIYVDRWTGSDWTDITGDVPLRGYPRLGLQALYIQKVPTNNTALARFSIEGANCWDTDPGDEIRVVGDLATLFGGFVGRRQMVRRDATIGANYSLRDYNSLMDRTVIPGYTIDDGDADDTEITTLVNTYLVPLGVGIGQIDQVQASLEEVFLQCTFRQAMETIAAQAAGAYFWIDAAKDFYYVDEPGDISGGTWSGVDLTDNAADVLIGDKPYEDAERIDDNTKRVDRVYIVGDGVEGWYGSGNYQAIVFDETVTTADALSALGASITQWQNPITEFHATCRSQIPMSSPGVGFRHSEWTLDSLDDYYVHRAELWVESDDGDEVGVRVEIGDHPVDQVTLGGPPPAGGGGRGPIFGDGSTTEPITPDDATVAGVERFAAREDHQHGFTCDAPSNIGNANAEGSAATMVRSDHVHNHPSGLGVDLHHAQSHVIATTAGLGAHHTTSGLTAGFVLRATGATTAAFAALQAGDMPALGATPALTLSTSNAAGTDGTYVRTDATILVFDATAPDAITPDQAGAAGSAGVAARRDHSHAITCAAPTTNLSVSSTDTEGAASTFARSNHTHAIDTSSNPGAAASILATDGSGHLTIGGALSLAQFIYHSGDVDTYVSLTDDRIQLVCGGVSMINIVEAATDNIGVGARVYMNANALYFDADNDTYAVSGSDDEVSLFVAGNEQYIWNATQLALHDNGGTERVRIRATGNVATDAADFWCANHGGFASQENTIIFIDCDNTGTANYFAVRKDAERMDQGSELFRVQENGRVGVGSAAPNAIIHAVQDSATGATSVLRLDQDDVDMSFVSFTGTAASGVLTNSIVEASEPSTITSEGLIKVYVTDLGNQLADGYYYMRVWSLA